MILKLVKEQDVEIMECKCVHSRSVVVESEKEFDKFIEEVGFPAYCWGFKNRDEIFKTNHIHMYHLSVEKLNNEYVNIITYDSGIFLMNNDGKTIEIISK